MVTENRPVDPGSIQGSDRPISFIRIKHRTRANDNLCKCLMYHAACKVELKPFTRSYSQLTFFNFLLKKKRGAAVTFCLIVFSATHLHANTVVRN